MYTFTNYLLYKYVGSVVCPFKVIFCGIFGVHLRAYGWLEEWSPLHLQECLRTVIWTGPFKPCFNALAEIFCTWIVFSQFSREIEVLWARGRISRCTQKNQPWGLEAAEVFELCLHAFIQAQQEFSFFWVRGILKSGSMQTPLGYGDGAGKRLCMGRVRFRDKKEIKKGSSSLSNSYVPCYLHFLVNLKSP